MAERLARPPATQPDTDAEHTAPSEYTRIAWIVATAVFGVALLLFLITGSVRTVTNSWLIYEWDWWRHNVEARTGLPKDQFIRGTEQIVEYFNDDTEFLDLRVHFGDGQDVPLYRQREILHMKDVKDLIQLVYLVEWLAFAYILAFLAAGFYLRRWGFLQPLRTSMIWTGAGTLLVVGGLGVASLIDFDAVFLQFHLIGFSNDLWLLDYNDFLLRMFPQGFFLDATLAVAIGSILGYLSLTAVVFWFARRVRNRQSAARDSEA
jgi:integral membrane protein (TIGR01906 family)